jgi:hypothetical protein
MTRRAVARALAGLTGPGLAAAFPLAPALALTAAMASPVASADSFTPVRLTITVAPVARRHAPLKITVGVSADAGVLDGSAGPLRVEVKLAGECGGTFQTTPGDTLLNKALSPAPATGKPYDGKLTGSGRPSAFGDDTVCVYLQDTQVGRLYANDESDQVDVSRPCTAAAGAYDTAQRRLRRTQRAAVRRPLKRTVARDRIRAVRACGRGVPL